MAVLARNVRQLPTVPGQSLLVMFAGEVYEAGGAGGRCVGEVAGGEGQDAVHEEGVSGCDLGDVGLPELE